MAGFLDYESVITIPGEETLIFALARADLTLFLESQPEGAQVTIDGEVIGTSPILDLTLEPGQHESSWKSEATIPGARSSPRALEKA